MISNVKIVPSSVEKAWCFIEPFNQNKEVIAEEVFNDVFGEGAWSKTREELDNRRAETTVDEPKPSISTTYNKDDVEQLRETLIETLHVTDNNGDWIEMY